MALAPMAATAQDATPDRVDITLSAGTEANPEASTTPTCSCSPTPVAEATDGQIQLRIYPNQQLGTEISMIEGLRSGSVDIAVVGVANFASFVPSFQIFSVPYIFESAEIYRAAMHPESEVWA
jgi:TRAP-type C4-dicarboxylate transport system substrate-binding protein